MPHRRTRSKMFPDTQPAFLFAAGSYPHAKAVSTKLAKRANRSTFPSAMIDTSERQSTRSSALRQANYILAKVDLQLLHSPTGPKLSETLSSGASERALRIVGTFRRLERRTLVAAWSRCQIR